MNSDKRHEIRRALPSDAERLLTCLQSLDQESQFLLYEPDERDANINTQRALLEQLGENHRNLLLVADTQDEIVGYLGARGGILRRNRHVLASLSLGVMQAYQRAGVGRSLLVNTIRWARAEGFRRIEFTVHSENRGAINLYLALGFQVEGTRRESLCIEGRWVDELWMSKIL